MPGSSPFVLPAILMSRKTFVVISGSVDAAPATEGAAIADPATRANFSRISRLDEVCDAIDSSMRMAPSPFEEASLRAAAGATAEEEQPRAKAEVRTAPESGMLEKQWQLGTNAKARIRVLANTLCERRASNMMRPFDATNGVCAGFDLCGPAHRHIVYLCTEGSWTFRYLGKVCG